MTTGSSLTREEAEGWLPIGTPNTLGRSRVDVVVKGRNVEVPDHYRVHVAEKLHKIERYDQKIIEVSVELLTNAILVSLTTANALRSPVSPGVQWCGQRPAPATSTPPWTRRWRN